MTREHLMEIFSAGLSRFLERKCVTVQFLAKQVECTDQNIYKMLAGQSLPSFRVLVRLMHEGMRLDEIFGEVRAHMLVTSYTEHKATEKPTQAAMIAKDVLQLLLDHVNEIHEGVKSPDVPKDTKTHGT
jgi:hypothetical protein